MAGLGQAWPIPAPSTPSMMSRSRSPLPEPTPLRLQTLTAPTGPHGSLQPAGQSPLSWPRHGRPLVSPGCPPVCACARGTEASWRSAQPLACSPAPCAWTPARRCHSGLWAPRNRSVEGPEATWPGAVSQPQPRPQSLVECGARAASPEPIQRMDETTGSSGLAPACLALLAAHHCSRITSRLWFSCSSWPLSLCHCALALAVAPAWHARLSLAESMPQSHWLGVFTPTVAGTPPGSHNTCWPPWLWSLCGGALERG